MLSISKPLSARQLLRYHAEEFLNAKENYYSAGEIRGTWHGHLAARWDLHGIARDDHFERLAEGQHPITGAPLVRHQTPRTRTNEHGQTVTTMEHRAGWDLTWSAPKSISLAALVGGDARIRDAHRASVAVALDETEQYVQARLGGQHPAETTRNWVATLFEHDSARPVQGYAAPQLHTHAVVFNLTQTAADEIRPLQPVELYRTQTYATAVYWAELAARLGPLGYEIDRGASGQPEIRGFTDAYLEASSPRRRQIEAHLAAVGQHSPEAAEIAAHRTREPKRACSHEEMQRRHAELAHAFGDQPFAVVQAARERAATLERTPIAITADAAVAFARDRQLEREAVVDERALVRDALARGMGHQSLHDIKQAVEQRISEGEFVAVTPRSGAPGRAFTTQDMIALEHETIRLMRRGQAQHDPLVSEAVRHAIDREHPHLNEHQRTAVQQLLAVRDQVVALEGVAGAGKTTTLAVVRAAAEREGYRVAGFAPTSRAAQQLAQAGIQTDTLQAYVASSRRPEHQLVHLYVLDESSLASTRQMHAFLGRLGPRDRVLLVGDIRQHQGVEAGRPYQQLQEAGMAITRLDHILRQQDPALKQVVEHLAHGDITHAIRHLEDQHRVHEIPDRHARLQQITDAYIRQTERTLVISPDHRSRMELNERIHDARRATGQVLQTEHRVSVWVPRQDLTGADRQWAARYQPGDVVRYSKGSTVVGLEAGEHVRVEAVHPDDNTVVVSRTSGAWVRYDPRRLQGVTVYREAERAFAVGDRIQLTAPDRERQIGNRELGTIQRIENRMMQVRFDSGHTVFYNVDKERHLDYGYAVTSHSSQGLTADRVLVHVDTEQGETLVNRRFAYVAVSRARDDAQIYTNDADRLAATLGREISHAAAIEVTSVSAPTQTRDRSLGVRQAKAQTLALTP